MTDITKLANLIAEEFELEVKDVKKFLGTKEVKTILSSKGEGKKGKKEKKDPNAPKRPKSGYLIFSIEARPGVKEENPGIAFGAIATEISKKWHAMGDKQKKPYMDKAAKDKVRYEKEKASYDKKHGITKKTTKKPAQKKVAEDDDDSSEEEKPVKKTTKKPTTKKTTKKPATKKPAKKPVKKPAKKPVKKPAKKPAKKPVSDDESDDSLSYGSDSE